MKILLLRKFAGHRKAHAAEHGNDLGRIVQALRRRERESDRPLLNPGPKKQLSPTESRYYLMLVGCGEFQRVNWLD